ncbi:MAG: hypothetical protein H7308_18240 [Chthonomonadaceae bacterium]|nr:hypothetical protein [Chthonomonadaceae bacterium]
MRRFKTLTLITSFFAGASVGGLTQTPAPPSPKSTTGQTPKVKALSSPKATNAPKNWHWIWAKSEAPVPDTVFFRQKFALPTKPISAKLRIVADDSFSVQFNGKAQPIASGGDWTLVQEFDVAPYLRVGENLIAVEATNNDGPGGLLYKLVITLPGKKTVTVSSGSTTKANRRPPPTWYTSNFEDKGWENAREIAPAGGGTWGELRGAPTPDPSRPVRLWDIRATATNPMLDPYARPRLPGERMLMSASITSPNEMQILAGAGFTLFQSDPDHLSTDQTGLNSWDFKNADAQRKTAQSLGLDWAYFPHNAFPPPWYRQSVPFTRLQCLEHHTTVAGFSLWEPTWGGFIEKNYNALSQEFGGGTGERNAHKLSAVYVGIHGDYGESGLLQGARISIPAQREDWERQFGDLHNHLGFWCDDTLARADFADEMLTKYGTLDALNLAWKRDYKIREDILYPEKPRLEAREEWLDFTNWYAESVGKAVELNLGAARRIFPDTLLMLPAGFGDEDVRGGNDNSLLPKLAAKYGATLRSTHSALRPFAENAATMFGRLGSACRFYGTPFWAEPPSGLTAQQETERMFEAISQGATGIFDWASNALLHRDLYYRYGKLLRVEKPIVDVALFYPAQAQKLRPSQPFAPAFAYGATLLRDTANFDILDDRMVGDGALAKYRVLALWEGTQASSETLEKIKAWVRDGGTLLSYNFGKVTDFSGSTLWQEELFGYAKELSPARVTERYVGNLPSRYAVVPGSPAAADYLSGDWFTPEMQGEETVRWTGAKAIVRLPVNPEARYTLVIRATVPPEVVEKKRRVLLNGRELGTLSSPGEVTYRFVVSSDLLAGATIARLQIESETFPSPYSKADVTDDRKLGVLIHSIQLVSQTAKSTGDTIASLPGKIERELNVQELRGNWARKFGKGLTIYFPGTRALLPGYLEAIRQATYNLSAIDPGKRDALPIDTAGDGVYATLFSDRILYYNSNETTVTKTVTLPAKTLEAWSNEISMPSVLSDKLVLEPHAMGVFYLTPPSQELLFECEAFTDIGALKPAPDPRCSPGVGDTRIFLPKNAKISTRFKVEKEGMFKVFLRATRNNLPEPTSVEIDDHLVEGVPTRTGQCFLMGTVRLTKGSHALTLKTTSREVNADFVLLTDDATISGYDFAVKTAEVE